MKKRYVINLYGCDDTTSWTMELTDEEAKLITALSNKSIDASSYPCMPTLDIYEEANT